MVLLGMSHRGHFKDRIIPDPEEELRLKQRDSRTKLVEARWALGHNSDSLREEEVQGLAPLARRAA
jgi:hypothetical protein